ncbi:14286_t:CDS:2, partial [Dentiscutata heterogama]
MATHNFDLPNSEQPIRSLVAPTSLSPSPSLVPNCLSPTSTNEELWTEIRSLNQRRAKLEQQRIREEKRLGKKKAVLPDYLVCAIFGRYLEDHDFRKKFY